MPSAACTQANLGSVVGWAGSIRAASWETPVNGNGVASSRSSVNAPSLYEPSRYLFVGSSDHQRDRTAVIPAVQPDWEVAGVSEHEGGDGRGPAW